MATLPPMKKVMESLTKARIQFEVFDRVSVEPTDASLQVAIEYCRSKQFSAFVAVGGGSVIDTGATPCNHTMCTAIYPFTIYHQPLIIFCPLIGSQQRKRPMLTCAMAMPLSWTSSMLPSVEV